MEGTNLGFTHIQIQASKVYLHRQRDDCSWMEGQDDNAFYCLPQNILNQMLPWPCKYSYSLYKLWCCCLKLLQNHLHRSWQRTLAAQSALMPDSPWRTTVSWSQLYILRKGRQYYCTLSCPVSKHFNVLIFWYVGMSMRVVVPDAATRVLKRTVVHFKSSTFKSWIIAKMWSETLLNCAIYAKFKMRLSACLRIFILLTFDDL